MASEMVERVARAICESELMNPDDALGGWIHWQHAARAAIEAMREPTEEMMVSAENVFPLLLTFADKEESGSYIAWRAMIDAALAEGGK